MLTIETFVNPIVLIYAGLIPEFRTTLEELMGLRFILCAIIGSISLSCLLFVAACRRLSAGEGYSGFRVKVYVRLTKILQKFKTVPSDDKNESVFGSSSNPLVARGRTWPYDREKYLRRLQWGGFFLTMVPLALGYWNEPERFLSASREVNAFVWLGAACLVAIIGASSVVSDRRNGFFEMILQTSLDPRQIIDGTVWTVFRHLRIGLVTSWIVGAMFLFDPDRRFLYLVPCILITGTLFVIVVMYFSVSCSLIARELSTPVSLSMLFTLGFLFVIAAPFLSTTHPQSYFDVFAVIVIVLGLWYGLRKMSVAAVGGLFIAVYLGFAWLGNSWNYSVQPLFPMSAMFPIFWIDCLMNPYEHHGLIRYSGLGRWWQSLGCYWLSMIATIVWSRWWLIRNFDRLVGRTLDKPDGWPKSVLAAAKVQQIQPE